MNTENLLVDYYSQDKALSKEKVQIIKIEDILRECKKNDILLKEEQLAKECFLVLKGCIKKRYYLDDGDGKIMEYHTENGPIAPASYINQELSMLLFLQVLRKEHGDSCKNFQGLSRFSLKWAIVYQQINRCF